MSLGWQGESALLPRKAKPITVDSKSMVRLKATILDEQQKMSFRKNEKTPRLRGSRGAKSGDRKDVFAERNAGLEDRKKRDLEDSSNVQSKDKVARTLAEKAKIYEEMKSGSLDIGKSSSALLINFDNKDKCSSHQIKDDPQQSSVVYDTDEMGRMKRPKMCSSYYGPGDGGVGDRKDNASAWEWSRGKPSKEEDEIDFTVEREYTKYIEGRLQAAADGRGDSSAATASGPAAHSYSDKQSTRHQDASYISEASRVKSQWEKTLHGESKHHLEAIHQETQNLRKQHEQGSGGAQERVIDGTSSGGKSGGPQVENRLAMLKRKQLERKMKVAGSAPNSSSSDPTFTSQT